jgi:hypothetical protein
MGSSKPLESEALSTVSRAKRTVAIHPACYLHEQNLEEGSRVQLTAAVQSYLV